jgi:hypothetical protein
MRGLARNPGGGPESRLWAAVVERGQGCPNGSTRRRTPRNRLCTGLSIGACLGIARGRDRGRFPISRGGADEVGSRPNKEGTTKDEGEGARSRRIGWERGVCGVAWLVRSTTTVSASRLASAPSPSERGSGAMPRQAPGMGEFFAAVRPTVAGSLSSQWANRVPCFVNETNSAYEDNDASQYNDKSLSCLVSSDSRSIVSNDVIVAGGVEYVGAIGAGIGDPPNSDRTAGTQA